MSKVKVISNQSVFDLAIQVLGNIDAAFDLAFANGISVTSELVAGQELIIPSSLFTQLDVSNYYNARKKKIATHIKLVQGDLSPAPDGIGYMIINESFIVD